MEFYAVGKQRVVNFVASSHLRVLAATDDSISCCQVHAINYLRCRRMFSADTQACRRCDGSPPTTFLLQKEFGNKSIVL
jgi:hypothetical protein